MPDADTAIRVTNAMRDHLPLLQALSANSPFWHGVDSGLASARAAIFRSAPRSEVPRAFAGWEDYLAAVDERDSGRSARLHPPVVGHPPAPAARDGRGALDE